MRVIFLILFLSVIFSFPAKADYCRWQIENNGDTLILRKGNVEYKLVNTRLTFNEVIEYLTEQNKLFDIESEERIHALSDKNGKTMHTFIFKEGSFIPYAFNVKTSAVGVVSPKRDFAEDFADVLLNCKF